MPSKGIEWLCTNCLWFNLIKCTFDFFNKKRLLEKPFEKIVILKEVNYLFSTFVLGNSLGGFRNSVLSEFSWEDKTDSSLDFFGSDGGALVVSSELGSFTSNTFEDIINERVHDTHSLLGNVNIGVALTEDLENVARV